MTRAEQEAREIHYLALIEANRIVREQWDKGYKQAEKDLALTWKDIKKIDSLSMEVTTLFASIDRNKNILERPFYEEIARRFNEIRKK